MVAILPFMLYQLAGFRTLDFLVPKTVNWIINIGIVCLIVASYILYREGDYPMERRLAATLVIAMAIIVFYGVLKLRRMQATYDAHCPPKALNNDLKAMGAVLAFCGKHGLTSSVSLMATLCAMSHL